PSALTFFTKVVSTGTGAPLPLGGLIVIVILTPTYNKISNQTELFVPFD
ncbi:TPA: hypothetical protein SH122_002883, partial [Staphylococcus aureus]|nr:hypothetical protein [Staphylococcus aureus]HEH8100024.1 hypothetical protein [Staphylococcus aureus]